MMRIPLVWAAAPFYYLYQAVCATLRFHERRREAVDSLDAAGERMVFCLWHDELFPLMRVRRDLDIVTVVSPSRDGELLARVLEKLGLRTVRGFDEVFYAPHSRHTELCREEVDACPALRVLAESGRAGLHILATDSGRQIFVCGHMEYDRDTLRLEYERDVKRGLPIAVPENYFEDDDPAKGVVFRWRSHANLFFSNWLNYYVYQETPYDLEKL